MYATVIIGITMGVNQLIRVSNIFAELVLSVVVAIIIPVIIITLVSGRTEEYKYYINIIKNILFRKKEVKQWLMKKMDKQEKQKVENAVIYPIECFNPYDDPTGRLYKTKQTYSIHWYAKSWMDKKTVLRSKLTKPLHRVLKFFGRSAKWSEY